MDRCGTLSLIPRILKDRIVLPVSMSFRRSLHGQHRLDEDTWSKQMPTWLVLVQDLAGQLD